MVTPSRRVHSRHRPVPLVMLLVAVLTLTASGQSFTVLKSFGILTNVTGLHPRAPLLQSPDGFLYGTAAADGDTASGTLFKLKPDGTGFRVLKWFTNGSEGLFPVGGLVLSGTTLYGTTSHGGAPSPLNLGTVFKVNTDGSGYGVVTDFTGSSSPGNPAATGFRPTGLVLSGRTLYGVCSSGGTYNLGTVYKVDTNGSRLTLLKEFTGQDGISPVGNLVESGGVLFGATFGGGVGDGGTVFRIGTDGSGFRILKSFSIYDQDGAAPMAGLVWSGGTLYGTTSSSGGLFGGTLFKINADGSGYAVLKRFNIDELDGLNPEAALVVSGSTLYGTTARGGAFDFGTVFKLALTGTGYTVLKHFTGRFPDDGASPSGLILSGNMLLGTASGSADLAPGCGTVFAVRTDGLSYQTLKNFRPSDAARPLAELAMSGATLYGTTFGGGTSDRGTVFKVNTDGSGYAILKSFGDQLGDGIHPQGGLVLSGDTLYGTTRQVLGAGGGTVFRIKMDGSGYLVLKYFDEFDDGSEPESSLVVSGPILYGTTSGGGELGAGTVFRLNTDGSGYRILKHFEGIDGQTPGRLILSGGILYGSTTSGGSSDQGTLFRLSTTGAGFAILREFGESDGEAPSGLVLSERSLFGTTASGGPGGNVGGTVFRINTDGSGFAILKAFQLLGDGYSPVAGLALSGQTLYGTTLHGGALEFAGGTVFKINTNGTGYAVLKGFSSGVEGFQSYAAVIIGDNALYGVTSAGGTSYLLESDSANAGGGVVFRVGLEPQILLTTQPDHGHLAFTWRAVPDQVYQVQYTTTLVPALWRNLDKPIKATSPTLSARIPASESRGFYRVVLQP